MADRAGYTLLFDGECRICSAFARGVRMIDVRRNLRVRPIQESGPLLAAVPESVRLGAAHVVGPDGRVSSGAEAMPALVAALLDGPRLEGRLRGSEVSMAALDRAYRLMVELRGRLTCATPAPASAGRNPR